MREQNHEVLWSEMSRVEVKQAREAAWLVILPIGSTEQHGPHLPVDTDAYYASEIARRAAARAGNALVTPPVSFGVSPEHQDFHGTLSLRIETFLNLLRDICDSLVIQGFRKIVLLNGHGTNAPLIAAFNYDFMRTHGVSLASMSWFDLIPVDELREILEGGSGGSDHAGEFETSVALHLRPELVRRERAFADYGDEDHKRAITSFGMRGMFDPGVAVIAAHSLRQSGVNGDPTLATAEKGRLILDRAVERLVAFLKEYEESPADRLPWRTEEGP